MPLNIRIFKLLGGLIGLSTLAILTAVWIEATQDMRERIHKDLDFAQLVIEQALSNREDILFGAADVLVADYGFRRAVAIAVTGEEYTKTGAITEEELLTLKSVMSNHSARINSDLMAVLSLEGAVVASDSSDLSMQQALPYSFLVEKTIDQGGMIANVVINGKAYQIIMLVLSAPNPVGVVLVGFEIEGGLLRRFSSMIKMGVTLVSRDSGKAVIASSLDELPPEILASSTSRDIDLSIFSDASSRLIVRRFQPLAEADSFSILEFVISQPLAFWYTPVRVLLNNVLWVSLALFVFALLLGLVFARNLTRPLANLASMAKRIARGDYDTDAPFKGNSTEVTKLSQALFTMQSDIQHREERIRYQAEHDLVTGLLNKYAMMREIEARLESGQTFTVVAFRLIGFSEVNTAFGIEVGDAVLASLAERLRSLGGVCARIEANDFMWLPDNDVDEGALQRLREQLVRPHIINEVDLKLPVCAGILSVPEDTSDLAEVLRYSSIALENARQQPALIQRYQRGIEEGYLKRLDILRGLEAVLESNSDELSMVYQPKVCLESGRPGKFEALIRWSSKSLGFVPPDLFIPIAEQAGLINQVTDWVLRRVIRDILVWKEDGLAVTVAINLSVHDVAEPQLLTGLTDLLDKAKLSHSAVELEITESGLMEDPEVSIKHLEAIREAGFKLSIDDFGTGYSSLSYLKNMPVNELKIDKSFVLNLDSDEGDQTIVSAIIALAERFNLSVVAEGVETESAMQLLRSWGCNWAQGYHISRPMPADQVVNWSNSFHADSTEN